MNGKREGLVLGLLVALVTAGIAASGAGLAPAAAVVPAIPSARPATAIVAMPATSLPPPTPGQLRDSAVATPAATPSSSIPPPPSPPPTPAPSYTPSPTATDSPTPGQVIGHSVQGRAIVAQRIGQGAIKVVLIGDIHGEFEANTYVLAQQLVAHFQAHADEVPPEISLWIVPTMNPDGLAAGQRWNANGVDLNRNADTDLDGCAGNDWSADTVGHEGPHPGAGGAYPFSEPEARAVRDFLDDAWIAVFYHSAAGAIFVDTCQRHAPTARLAEVLSAASGYPVPAEGWTGYPVTGDFGDYLAGEGVAAVAVELTDHEDPEFERNLAGVRAILAAADEILRAEATEAGAEFTWLDETNAGTWQYDTNRFVHPIALEVVEATAYLLDGGRGLALDLARPSPPRLLLAPGDDVESVRVLEPLDLAVDGTSLLALDRAGDVYRYEPTADTWNVERYDRPVGDTYNHYFVALASGQGGNYLLETTHEQVWRFGRSSGGQKGAAWIKLPQGRDVDLSVRSDALDRVYTLRRALNGPLAEVACYRDAGPTAAAWQADETFRPGVRIMQPRQIVATEAAVYVLDRAGRRLLSLDWESGELLALYQFRDRRAASALWVDPSGERLILAGCDALYFPGVADRAAKIGGGAAWKGRPPHDPDLLEGLRGLAVPIEGAHVTSRDFQMPGAPRHYRLGVHEGLDFYGHTVGVAVNRKTPVRAVADGVVIRATKDYEPLSAALADAWAARCRSLGYTPAEVLDGYRGMQVWIEHGGGLVSRYAHLGSIAPGIVEGAKVSKGQVIATVGNSGTPASIRSQSEDVHLHLELWVEDPSASGSGPGYFAGQFLRPIEAREWLERILR